MLCTLYTKGFNEFCYLFAGLCICLSTESDILALATRVQKSLKDDGATAGINNAATLFNKIAIHEQT